jgi:hypothetical protein
MATRRELRDDARAAPAALKSAPPSSPGPCEAAAELLEERGDLLLAGEWYDAAASALQDDELAALAGEIGWASYPAHVLLGRSRVRRLLGVSPDEMDRAGCRTRERRGSGWFPSTGALLAAAGVPRRGQHPPRTLPHDLIETHGQLGVRVVGSYPQHRRSFPPAFASPACCD